jgi:hypothetical protein
VAFTLDTDGSETYTMYIRDMATGKVCGVRAQSFAERSCGSRSCVRAPSCVSVPCCVGVRMLAGAVGASPGNCPQRRQCCVCGAGSTGPHLGCQDAPGSVLLAVGRVCALHPHRTRAPLTLTLAPPAQSVPPAVLVLLLQQRTRYFDGGTCLGVLLPTGLTAAAALVRVRLHPPDRSVFRVPVVDA